MRLPTIVSSGRTRSVPRIGVIVAGLGLVVAAAVAVGVLLIAVGALVPGTGLLGGLAPVVVPARGPALVVAALVTSVFAWAARHWWRRAAAAVAGCGLVAGLALAAVVAVMVATTVDHGGSIDLGRAVWPTTDSGAVVDQRPVYTVGPDGTPLHLAVVYPPVVPGRSVPIMVWVHGGGWIGGSDLSRAADMRRFADLGWLAVSVEYSLARPGRPTWDVAGPQVACALTRVAMAGGRGGDLSRLVLGGDSAGGQLAVSVAYHAASGDQPSSCGGQVPVPRAVATNYPAVDLVDGFDHGARSSDPALDARALAVGYTGGTPTQVPDRYRAVSGAAAAGPGAPPTLVIAPAQDALVPPTGLARFVGEARRAGVDATLVSLPFTNHAYDTFGEGSLGQQAGFSILEHWSREHLR